MHKKGLSTKVEIGYINQSEVGKTTVLDLQKQKLDISIRGPSGSLPVIIYKSRNWIYQLEFGSDLYFLNYLQKQKLDISIRVRKTIKEAEASTKVEIGYINQSWKILILDCIYKSRNWIYQLEFLGLWGETKSTKVEIGYINQSAVDALTEFYLQKQKLDISIRVAAIVD